MSASEIALLALAIAIAAVGFFLSWVLINLFRVLESTKQLIDGIRQETVPLLGEVKTTVTNLNRELERMDGVMASAGNIVRSVERLSSIVERTVSSPLVKAAAFGAGARAAVKRLRGQK